MCGGGCGGGGGGGGSGGGGDENGEKEEEVEDHDDGRDDDGILMRGAKPIHPLGTRAAPLNLDGGGRKLQLSPMGKPPQQRDCYQSCKLIFYRLRGGW